MPEYEDAIVLFDDAQSLSLYELSQAYAQLTGNTATTSKSSPANDAASPDPEGESEAVESDACDISPLSILEAMLFVGHPENEPLTAALAASLMRGVEPSEISGLVDQLNAIYEEEDRAFTIRSEGNGFRLVLKKEHAPLRDNFYGRIREARLSPAAVDVLAVVAYHQPVTRDDVEKQRGVPSGAILTQLVRRNLLQMQRPAERPKTPIYTTTERFLDLFGLESVADLPQSQEIE